ncbi:MAG: Fic family protein [Blautia faecis]
MKSKETFRKNYFLHPAIKLDLIRMTIPDKPRSRSQKYIKL